jgi:hypothetical protein
MRVAIPIAVEQAYPKLIHYNKLDKRGHCGAVFRSILPAYG